MAVLVDLVSMLAGIALMAAGMAYIFAPQATRLELRNVGLGGAILLFVLPALLQLACLLDPFSFLMLIAAVSGTAYLIRRYRHPNKESAQPVRYADRTPMVPPDGGVEE